MGAKKHDLSIIIVTWNNENEIEPCLNSIFDNCEALSVEVIVVDNSSTDNTIKILEKYSSNLRIITNSANTGFAQANNQGLGTASGQQIMLLNPDTIVMIDALTTMVSYLDKNSLVGAVGPRLVWPNGETQQSCLRYPSLKSQFVGYIKGGKYLPNQLQQPSQVDALSGAALMVKCDVIETVGMLDTDFFMYAEDSDWCFRIHQAGWQIHYLPTPVITHFGGRSSKQIPIQTFVRYRVSKLQFFRKHRSRMDYEITKWLMAANLWIRRIKATGASKEYYKEVQTLFYQEISNLEQTRAK